MNIRSILDEIGLLNEPLQMELLRIIDDDPTTKINLNLNFIKKLLNSTEFSGDPQMITFVNNLFEMTRLYKLLSIA